MEFVDLPLCQREYQDLAMAEALINPGDVLLISGNAVKSLGDYNVEFSGSGVRQQRIDATFANSNPTSSALQPDSPQEVSWRAACSTTRTIDDNRF